MHNTVKNLLDIKNNIKIHLNKSNINNNPKIVAVSKTFKIDKIIPLIEFGHTDYGENKVQEALEKWTEVKKINPEIKLHMVGKLQTNKVKFAVQIFDYIHSVDSEKLAKKIADEQNKINKNQVGSLVSFSKDIGLNIIGLMCIPPANIDPENYFIQMNKLNNDLGFNELSMGMSSDYLTAAKHLSTYVRVGSSIFGQRS